jgi:hypothetical protein
MFWMSTGESKNFRFQIVDFRFPGAKCMTPILNLKSKIFNLKSN